MKASLNDNESGMALVTTLMVLMLASALMVGFFATIMADQKANGIDRDQSQAYAAAHAGLEKLTSDLATKFETDFSPTAVEINALSTHPPVIPGFQYTAPGGAVGSGYLVSFTTNAAGNPAPMSATGTPITAGPYAGFNGIITQYTITSTARSGGGAEVRLRRLLETVSVPVFQFGVFSETDLTFYGGDNFNFGGRVQTNGNLFLSELAGFTLSLSDRVTAFKDVIRNNLSNGLTTSAVGFTGVVNVPKTIGPPAVYQDLQENEGSVVGMPGSLPTTTPTSWTNISTGTYKKNIMSGLTGAKMLSLPLVAFGAAPIDLIVRPVVNEDVAKPLIYTQRYFSQASLRILLSDTRADITNLPTVTATLPVDLSQTVAVAAVGSYGPASATRPPIATSPGPQGTMATIGGSTITTAGPPAIMTIKLSAGGIPAFYQMPAGITVTSPGPVVKTVTCKGRNVTVPAGVTTLTGCLPVNAADVAAGAIVAAPVGVNSGAGLIVPPPTATTAIWTAASGTITVTNNTLGNFAPGLLWVGAPGAEEAMTCTGYDTVTIELRGCTGLAALPGAGVTIRNTRALSNPGTSLLNGFIKIELQNAAGAWVDVTTEILNFGIASRNQWPSSIALCADPNPNAILRLQRLRDNANGNCYYTGSQNSNDYWPNVLYDTREGNYRDPLPDPADGTLALGGVMNYVALDVNNLKRWLAGTVAPYIGGSGPNVLNQNGFIVYFSDRRNNRNTGVVIPSVETGEYGSEDVVNPASATGTPNALLDVGEDFNGNGVLDRYGENPVNIPALGAGFGTPPLNAASRPWTTALVTPEVGMANRPVLFRRALKLINGGIVGGVSSLPAPGLTVVAENPVYVQGNYNASSISANANPHLAASILADAVTVLSNNWNDTWPFFTPNDQAGRTATETAYRFAVVAGKGLSFPYPAAGAPMFLFGTDGGLGNFLRYLEDWTPAAGAQTIHYRGSIVILFNSRQAIGTYKCCQRVYSYSVRDYSFDTDFLVPNLLPPGTPMFRDVDTLTFRQLLRPNQ